MRRYRTITKILNLPLLPACHQAAVEVVPLMPVLRLALVVVGQQGGRRTLESVALPLIPSQSRHRDTNAALLSPPCRAEENNVHLCVRIQPPLDVGRLLRVMNAALLGPLCRAEENIVHQCGSVLPLLRRRSTYLPLALRVRVRGSVAPFRGEALFRLGVRVRTRPCGIPFPPLLVVPLCKKHAIGVPCLLLLLVRRQVKKRIRILMRTKILP